MWCKPAPHFRAFEIPTVIKIKLLPFYVTSFQLPLDCLFLHAGESEQNDWLELEKLCRLVTINSLTPNVLISEL
jgi:hypothetical protein